MPDPDLEIKGRERGGGGEGPVIQTLREAGGLDSKTFFRSFGPQFGLKISGVWGRVPRAPPLDPPLLSIFLNCGKDLHRFAHHCQHARNNSQHRGANNVD